MSFRDQVAAYGDRLTKADRQLLDVVLSHPTEVAFLPGGEVAARAGVHQATATKLAQKLGYDGYPGMRQALQHDLLNGSTPAERVRRRLEHAGPDSVLDALVADEAAALQELPRHVSQPELEAAAAVILEGRHVHVFGAGNAAVLAELLHRRLRRYGLRSTTLSSDGRDLAEQLVGLGAGDVVVTFAFRRIPRRLPILIEHAEASGARSILITDTLADVVSPAPHAVLTAPRGSGREFQSLTVPMAITNALVLTLARLAPDRTLAALETLRGLLDRLDD